MSLTAHHREHVLGLILLLCGSSYPTAAQTHSKLNVPRVLLPRASDVIVNFTLKVSDGNAKGCFSWRSTRADVVTVTPVLLDETGTPTYASSLPTCSSAAVVSAVSSSNTRLTSIVWAEHPSLQFRCDVIVDVITSLEISTTTQQLYLEDAPEAFEIRAKDDKGDTFTSLEGLEFDWRIENDVRGERGSFTDGGSILRMIKFSETNYRPPASIAALETTNRRGYMVLVEGIQTGSALVSAGLRSRIFGEVDRTRVRLLVVANVILIPDYDVYLVQHASLRYRVQQIKQTSTLDVALPSPQYFLQVVDDNVCHLDEKSSTVVCSQIGDTQVVLKDRNMHESEAEIPSSLIHVVQPAYINLLVLPGRNWILQNKATYIIIAELYDRESHQIYPSDNVMLGVVFDSDYFKVLHSTVNGTYIHVQTLETGRTQIIAELLGVKQSDGILMKFPASITKVQNVEILDPVNVHPKLLLFPFNPSWPLPLTPYEFQMEATGGSGNHTWTSSQTPIVSIDRTTGLLIAGQQEGLSQITAYDLRNPSHTDSATVYVMPVVDMVMPPSIREAQVGKILELPMALRGRVPGLPVPVVFTDCRWVNLSLSIDDENVFQVIGKSDEDARLQGGCLLVQLRALKPGFATLTIVYHLSDDLTVEGQVTVGAFEPLESLEPDRDVVLTLGSSKVFQFKGGPLPWIRNPQAYKVKLAEDKAGVVGNRSTRTSDGSTVLEVICLKLGEDRLILQVTNAPSASLPMPVTQTMQGQISCAEPTRLELHLRPVQLAAGTPLSAACPWPRLSNDAYPVLAGHETVVDLEVFDGVGRRFDNFSSLHFKWRTEGEGVKVRKEAGFWFPWHRSKLRHHIEGSTGHIVLDVKEKTGKTRLNAYVDHYDKPGFHKWRSLFPDKLAKPLQGSMDMQIVREPTFDKESVKVFNHPRNEESVGIDGGSGYFHLAMSKPALARLSYDSKAHSVIISPLLDGETRLSAYDLCLPAKPAELYLTVAGVERIEILVADKLEVGKSVGLLVRVYDSSGELIPVLHYGLIELAPSIVSDVISLREESATATDKLYSLHGNSVGRATVSFAGLRAGHESDRVVSNQVHIHVFAPLHLEPRNLTLHPTSQMQLEVHGGPQSQSGIVFAVQSSKIGKVDGNGLVEATQLGNTRIIAQLVHQDPVTGREVVYASDEVELHVVAFRGIRIRAGSRTVEVGREIPLLALGHNEYETPFAFATTTPLPAFDWSVDCNDCARIVSPLQQALTPNARENQFAVRLVALAAGTVTVRMNATTGDGKKFTDSVVIKIVDPLVLVDLDYCAVESVLLTPNSRTRLHTNKDQYGVSWKLTGQSEHSLVQVNERNGEISAGSQTGSGLITVEATQDDLTWRIPRLLEVKEASFLKISVMSDVRSREETSSLPVGLPLAFSVSLHDNLGRKFLATNSQLRFRTSRNDIVPVSWTTADNTTLTAKAVRAGSTVLKVWDAERPKDLFDFIEIRVAPVILPSSHEAHVGQVICFQCSLISPDGRRGTWTSASSHLQIDPETGVALAVTPGSALVSYNISNSQSSKAFVEIRPIMMVEFIDVVGVNKPVLTNAKGVDAEKEKPVIVPVSLGKASFGCSSIHPDLSVPLLDNLAQDMIHCSVRWSKPHPAGIPATDIFTARAQMDKQGKMSCAITRRPGVENSEAVLSNFESQVIVTASTGTANAVGAETVLDFLPAFHVQTPEIHLNHVQIEVNLLISMTPAVQKSLDVRSSDPGAVEVGTPTPSRDFREQVWSYPVKLLTGPSLASRLSTAPHLTISSFATHQSREIPVKIRLTPDLTRDSHRSRGQDVWSLIIPALIVGGLLGLLWLLWKLYQQNVQEKQYYQYLAVTGQAPPIATPQRVSPVKNNSPTGSDIIRRRLFKEEDLGVDRSPLARTDDQLGAQLWSTNRGLPDSGSSSPNKLYRRSPNVL